MCRALELNVQGPGAKLVGTWGQMCRALGLNGQSPEDEWAGPWG